MGKRSSRVGVTTGHNAAAVQKEKPKVTKSTTVKQIKTTITGLAQEMIDSVNTLSDLALGTKAAKTSIETETLSTIVLDLVRSNIKLYGKCIVTQRPFRFTSTRNRYKRISLSRSTRRSSSRLLSPSSNKRS